MSRKLLVLALLLAGTLLMAPQAAAQTTATTSVSINLPSFVMLYYRSSVTFNPTNAVMASLISEAANPADEGAVILTDFTGSADVDGTSTGFTPLGSATATVNNFWGVRSLAPPTGTTRVTVSFPTGGDSLSNGTDTISLSAIQTRLPAGTFSGSSVTFSPTGLGAGSVQLGDVTFQVDLSGVTTSGSYTGGSIEITAENI